MTWQSFRLSFYGIEPHEAQVIDQERGGEAGQYQGRNPQQAPLWQGQHNSGKQPYRRECHQ